MIRIRNIRTVINKIKDNELGKYQYGNVIVTVTPNTDELRRESVRNRVKKMYWKRVGQRKCTRCGKRKAEIGRICSVCKGNVL